MIYIGREKPVKDSRSRKEQSALSIAGGRVRSRALLKKKRNKRDSLTKGYISFVSKGSSLEGRERR